MIVPKTGYRLTDPTRERDRWRNCLFDQLRRSPRYRELAGESPEAVATALGLVQGGRCCPWAVELIERDSKGCFHPDKLPKRIQRMETRVIDLTAGIDRMEAHTHGLAIPEDGDFTEHRPGDLGRIAAEDWDVFENMAAQAARDAVRSMRDAMRRDRQQQQAVHEVKKSQQIERLAYRLTGRSGKRNPRSTEHRLCQELGIDTPTGK